MFCMHTAASASAKLADHKAKHSRTECGALIERVLLKQDEIDELVRRLVQRRLFDDFLDAEKNVEYAFRKRILKMIQTGPEASQRKHELVEEFNSELQWFMDTVDE